MGELTRYPHRSDLDSARAQSGYIALDILTCHPRANLTRPAGKLAHGAPGAVNILGVRIDGDEAHRLGLIFLRDEFFCAIERFQEASNLRLLDVRHLPQADGSAMPKSRAVLVSHTRASVAILERSIRPYLQDARASFLTGVRPLLGLGAWRRWWWC